jgi:glycosyltransferase involved in cell wall biosynthesis
VPSTTTREPTSDAGPRPRVVYISYDGVQEPLGRSQVLPYLTRVSSRYAITLVSFEKSRPPAALRAELERGGIDWRPLRYHRRPPVLSTALDVLVGTWALLRVARSGRAAIVHARSYIAALIGVLARSRTGGRLLFDIRGFWADERVDGGLWRPGGVLYRLAKRVERGLFARADAIVTLTEASIPQIRAWADASSAPIVVIPTCAEVERFAGRPPRPGGPHLLWCGSLGTWYRFDLAGPVAAAISLPLTVVTRQGEQARALLAGRDADVRSIAPDRVPDELFAGDIGLCLIRSAPSKIASLPTRFAEYLAAGMPVLVTAGVGGLDELVTRHRVGVVLRGDDRPAIARAVRELEALKGDPTVSERCRELARAQFDVNAGAARYEALYGQLTSG